MTYCLFLCSLQKEDCRCWARLPRWRGRVWSSARPAPLPDPRPETRCWAAPSHRDPSRPRLLLAACSLSVSPEPPFDGKPRGTCEENIYTTRQVCSTKHPSSTVSKISLLQRHSFKGIIKDVKHTGFYSQNACQQTAPQNYRLPSSQNFHYVVFWPWTQCAVMHSEFGLVCYVYFSLWKIFLKRLNRIRTKFHRRGALLQNRSEHPLKSSPLTLVSQERNTAFSWNHLGKERERWQVYLHCNVDIKILKNITPDICTKSLK